MPKNGMVILDLATGKAARVERVKSFQVPEDGGGYIAYLHFPVSQPASSTAANEGTPARRAGPKKDYGGDLIVRRLADGNERTIPDVAEFSLSNDGKLLVYALASRSEESNGVYAIPPASDAAPVTVLAGAGKYTKLAWDEAQHQLAFLSTHDDAAARRPKYKLYLWNRQGTATEVASDQTPGFRAGFAISDHAAPSFSKNGEHLFFGCVPVPQRTSRDGDGANGAEAPLPDERAAFDLWSWKDDYIQPMQKVRVQMERNRSYRAVYNIADRKLVQLADPTMEDLTPSEDGRWALGGDDREYRPMVDYGERFSDAYLVDTMTGARTLLAKKHIGRITWSPDGKYALLFDGKNWNTISVPDARTVNLTGSLGVKFWQEDHDSPGVAPAYGMAGWTKDGKYVLLYDRFDIWRVNPDGSAAKNLTAGTGRKEHLAFRYVKLNPDPKDRWIDPSAPLLLRAENMDTHDTGFYRTSMEGSEQPLKLRMAAKNFSSPLKAKRADVLLLTESSFNEFPDLQVTDFSFRELRKISDANPQMSKLDWGTSELFDYRNADGAKLSGVLYKPENFDPKKKYPMIVYLYERLSQNVHHFVPPAPGHSINFSYYVSNGYLIMTPDIVYTIGYPGDSALKCVLAAVQEMVDRGFVDEKRIGIQGHSWGGYQIAYMLTRTNRFRAAEAGAPVADMVSAYDGIRWGSGLPRQFQYEQTQSRIGGSLWQYPLRYIENSPIFEADRVNTPLMILHNDADDAVPWYQGIEYYLALRRLGKEVYFFSYYGEPHHLTKRPNQKDYTVRLQQFFDHYLKDAPEPDWMVKGIPYIEHAAPPPATTDER